MLQPSRMVSCSHQGCPCGLVLRPPATNWNRTPLAGVLLQQLRDTATHSPATCCSEPLVRLVSRLLRGAMGIAVHHQRLLVLLKHTSEQGELTSTSSSPLFTHFISSAEHRNHQSLITNPMEHGTDNQKHRHKLTLCPVCVGSLTRPLLRVPPAAAYAERSSLVGPARPHGALLHESACRSKLLSIRCGVSCQSVVSRLAFLRRKSQARCAAPSVHPVYLLNAQRSEQHESTKRQAVSARQRCADPS